SPCWRTPSLRTSVGVDSLDFDQSCGGTVMPTTHEATATWRGDLASGKGDVSTTSGALKRAATSWTERTEGTGAAAATSPEELLAAAHASCFSMAFAARLAKAGIADPNITVTAKVTFGPKPEGGNAVLASVLRV